MNNVFQYVGLSISLITAISNMMKLHKAKQLTGATVHDSLKPVIHNVNGILPHAVIPDELAASIAGAVAEAIVSHPAAKPARI